MSDKLNFEINDDTIQEITSLGDYTITHTRSRYGNSSGYWTFDFYDVEKEDTTYSKSFDSLLETVVAAQTHYRKIKRRKEKLKDARNIL